MLRLHIKYNGTVPPFQETLDLSHSNVRIHISGQLSASRDRHSLQWANNEAMSRTNLRAKPKTNKETKGRYSLKLY